MRRPSYRPENQKPSRKIIQMIKRNCFQSVSQIDRSFITKKLLCTNDKKRKWFRGVSHLNSGNRPTTLHSLLSCGCVQRQALPICFSSYKNRNEVVFNLIIWKFLIEKICICKQYSNENPKAASVLFGLSQGDNNNNYDVFIFNEQNTWFNKQIEFSGNQQTLAER